MNIAAYRKCLDPLVVPQSFVRDYSILGHVFAHLAIVLVCAAAVALHVSTIPWWLVGLVMVLAGHSVAVLGMANHELGHRRPLRPMWLGWLVEVLTLTFVVFAVPIIQRRAHNVFHHGFTNSPRDPDRRFTVEELHAYGLSHVAPWFFPNSRHPVIGGLLGFCLALPNYHSRLLWHSVCGKRDIFDMRLRPRERWVAGINFLWNVSAYTGLAALARFEPRMLIFLAGMHGIATTIAALYILTNHLLNVQGEADYDPLAQSVSLRLPAWLDWLHLRLSHHSEHHIYPTASYRDLPAIRATILAEMPERLHLLSFTQAIRLLLGTPLAVTEQVYLVHPDGSGRIPAPFGQPAPQTDAV